MLQKRYECILKGWFMDVPFSFISFRQFSLFSFNFNCSFRSFRKASGSKKGGVEVKKYASGSYWGFFLKQGHWQLKGLYY
jgi:hypothetical protein